VARSGLFGSRTDRDHDGVDDRTETREPVAEETVSERHRTYSTRSPMADRDRDGIDDRDETPTERLDAADSAPPVERVEPVAPVSPVDRTDERAADRGVARPVMRARASLAATIGVMVGLVGVVAALTGLLAPFGVVLGVIGLLFSFAGMSAGRRPNVAGRGLGALGLLVSFVAIVFSVLALTHSASWLDSNVDQVAKLRDWVNVQMPWMKTW
jgi:VIT1/CCC1 family predicted Fe2+/Mn2+ transporter